MQNWLLVVCLSFSTVITFCQTEKKSVKYNFGFEEKDTNKHLPEHWFNWGSGYDLITDTQEKKSGKASILIRPAGDIGAEDVGSVGYAIPANFSGREIELRAYMKLLNVSNGSAFLGIIAADSTEERIDSENLKEANIHGTSDWTLYSLKMRFPENTKTIYIAVALDGKGQLWADDFRLYMDGREIKSGIQHKKIEFKADQDKEFDEDSKISLADLDAAKAEDLFLLGKIWGFLKYYHPAIANGDYNWDYELFRILPQILAATDQTARNKILEKWVTSLGKVKSGQKGNTAGDQIKLSPELAWIDNPALGARLNRRLTDIMNAMRTGDHYYVDLAPSVGNPRFEEERPYDKKEYPDPGFRLLSLYRYWNIIEYYFPYRNLIQENWDDVLKEFLPRFINAPNELEYNKAVLALIARIHDSHANIFYQDSVLMKYKGLNFVPVDVKFVEEQTVVTSFSDKGLGEQTGLDVGDVIEAINHKKVKEIIREKLPYTSASNYTGKLRSIGKNLLRSNDTILTLDGRRDGIPFSLVVKCNGKEKTAPYFDFINGDTCFKLLTPEIAYLYPGSIKNKYLPGIMPEILKTKGLIIDLRCYPSEFIVFSLSEYLQPDQTAFVKFSNGSIITPGLFTMTDTLMVGRKNEDYYKGKVVILVNEETQSQAEYTAMAFRTAPGAVVIGSTTAGADGNVSRLYLPGGILTMISGIGVYYPDGTETQRVGIVPDIEVKPTIRGIREGRDEVLERAMAIILEQ